MTARDPVGVCTPEMFEGSFLDLTGYNQQNDLWRSFASRVSVQHPRVKRLTDLTRRIEARSTGIRTRPEARRRLLQEELERVALAADAGDALGDDRLEQPGVELDRLPVEPDLRAGRLVLPVHLRPSSSPADAGPGPGAAPRAASPPPAGRGSPATGRSGPTRRSSPAAARGRRHRGPRRRPRRADASAVAGAPPAAVQAGQPGRPVPRPRVRARRSVRCRGGVTRSRFGRRRRGRQVMSVSVSAGAAARCSFAWPWFVSLRGPDPRSRCSWRQQYNAPQEHLP